MEQDRHPYLIILLISAAICKDAGLPEPIIEENQGGISIVFLKDIYTEDYLRKFDINERQVKALVYIKEHGNITNRLYQDITHISKPGATLDLQDLVSRALISKVGTTGRGTYYILNRKG